MKQSMSVLTSMATNKYGTPRWYISLVHKVFNARIDLDPATSYSFNARYIRAKQFYTLNDDGLSLPWNAENVFINPPYSAENGKRTATTSKWMDKAVTEYVNGNYGECIALVNFKAGYKWMNNLIDNDLVTVFVHRDRVAFINDLGHTCKPSRQPQATIYIGERVPEFLDVFGPEGWLIG